jgi:hypothetical protein
MFSIINLLLFTLSPGVYSRSVVVDHMNQDMQIQGEALHNNRENDASEIKIRAKRGCCTRCFRDPNGRRYCGRLCGGYCL